MKKKFILAGIGMLALQLTYSQASNSKTSLAQQVTQAAAANRKQLSQYVWNRTVQVYLNDELKMTNVSSISFGPDGKLKSQEMSSTPTSKPKRGIRGDIERKKVKELKDYVSGAVKLSMSYMYLPKEKMTSYFNSATITESGNTINVQGNSVNQTGDQLLLVLSQGSLAYVKQTFNTTYNNTDAINGSLNYKTFSNGLNAVDQGELNLPVKNIRLVISNAGFAKVLQ